MVVDQPTEITDKMRWSLLASRIHKESLMNFIFDSASSSSKDREEVSTQEFSLRLLQKFRWISQNEAEKMSQWLIGGANARSMCRKICKTLSEKLMPQSTYEVITEREESILLQKLKDRSVELKITH